MAIRRCSAAWIAFSSSIKGSLWLLLKNTPQLSHGISHLKSRFFHTRQSDLPTQVAGAPIQKRSPKSLKTLVSLHHKRHNPSQDKCSLSFKCHRQSSTRFRSKSSKSTPRRFEKLSNKHYPMSSLHSLIKARLRSRLSTARASRIWHPSKTSTHRYLWHKWRLNLTTLATVKTGNMCSNFHSR